MKKKMCLLGEAKCLSLQGALCLWSRDKILYLPIGA